MDVLARPALVVLVIPFVALALVVAVVVVLVTRSGERGQAPPPPGSVPPGWYPQPDGGMRYWNGVAWTGDVRPPDGPTPTG